MQFTIKTNDLKALLLCAAKQDIRYYLNGVHFESTQHGIIAASTDGHRLLCINLPNEKAEGVNGTIPRALIEQAVKTKAPMVDVSIEGASVTLSSAGQSVSAALVEGKFPDFRRVVPEKVSNEPGNEFNNEYLVDFDKVGKLINGGKASVIQNGVGFSALVHYDNPDVIGVLMPLRHDAPKGTLRRPAWLDNAAPMQAAA